MCDPKRIERILSKLARLWNQNPDWRLGQIIFNAAHEGGWSNYNVFYCDDERMEKGLEQLTWNGHQSSSDSA